MIQNSLSPVVKSRISSSSGRTIRVEKRSFARTGIMSSLEYLTTRAASVAAHAAENGKAVTKTTIATQHTKPSCHELEKARFIFSLLWKMLFASGNLKSGRRKIAGSAEPRRRPPRYILRARKGTSDTAGRP